jgi:hypothetical protein
MPNQYVTDNFPTVNAPLEAWPIMPARRLARARDCFAPGDRRFITDRGFAAVAVDSFWGVRPPPSFPPLKTHQRLLKRHCGLSGGSGQHRPAGWQL